LLVFIEVNATQRQENRMNKTVLIIAALVASAAAVQAQEPEDYIKYRQAVMEAIGGHSGAASQIVRGKVSPEGALAMHADALAALNADLASLFPEGSDFGETRAKAEIWENWTRRRGQDRHRGIRGSRCRRRQRQDRRRLPRCRRGLQGLPQGIPRERRLGPDPWRAGRC